MSKSLAAAAAVLAAVILPASAKKPAAPSDLTVKALGVNAFQLKWKDNSTNETGWEILAAPKGLKPTRFTLLPGAGNPSRVIVTAPLTGQEVSFQVAAYKGETGSEVFSKPTEIVNVRAYRNDKFAPPEKFRAKALDDGVIKLIWKDKSTSENGYQIEYRTGASKTWEQLGNTDPGKRFHIRVSGFAPATRYTFRVRAYRGNPVETTKWAKKVRVQTEAFRAPSSFAAVRSGAGALAFRWSDNSSAESGFELQSRIGSTGDFTSMGTVGANVTSTPPITDFISGLTYQFRIRAFRGAGAEAVYSDFSSVISAQPE
jgi:titin